MVVSTPSEKYEFVGWDYSSQYMVSHKIHVPKTTKQYLYEYYNIYLIDTETWLFLGFGHPYLRLSENVGYIPHEITIFHRDNDHENHWV